MLERQPPRGTLQAQACACECRKHLWKSRLNRLSGQLWLVVQVQHSPSRAFCPCTILVIGRNVAMLAARKVPAEE